MSIEDSQAKAITAGGFVLHSDRVRKAPERFITAGSITIIGQPVIDLVVPGIASTLKKNTTDAHSVSTLKWKASTPKATTLAKRRHVAEGPSENGSIAHSDSMPMREVDTNEEITIQEINASHMLSVSDAASIEVLSISVAETPDVNRDLRSDGDEDDA